MRPFAGFAFESSVGTVIDLRILRPDAAATKNCFNSPLEREAMRELDQTDVDIIGLLVEDARRPYNEIAEAVGLSPPTVSDRIERLRELGVIRQFTVDLDRSLLSNGVSVLVDVHAAPGSEEAVQAALDGTDGVEHVFRTVDGHVICAATLDRRRIEAVIGDAAGEDAVREYDVKLLADTSWNPRPGVFGGSPGAVNGEAGGGETGIDFALDCDECGNTVTSEGVSSRIDGRLHQFCCTSCQGRFEERYEELSEGA